MGKSGKFAHLLGLTGSRGRAGYPPVCPPVYPPLKAPQNSLGHPLNQHQVAELIGCSPWTVRQKLIPLGLPYFRSGASGKLIFYTNQVVAWVQSKQNGGKTR